MLTEILQTQTLFFAFKNPVKSCRRLCISWKVGVVVQRWTRVS